MTLTLIGGLSHLKERETGIVVIAHPVISPPNIVTEGNFGQTFNSHLVAGLERVFIPPGWRTFEDCLKLGAIAQWDENTLKLICWVIPPTLGGTQAVLKVLLVCHPARWPLTVC